MSKTLCLITTQIYENYGAEIQGIYHDAWKKKGSFVFSLNIDFDYIMYSEEECIDTIKLLLEKKSSKLEKFEYISHQFVFNKIHELEDNFFEEIIKKKLIAKKEERMEFYANNGIDIANNTEKDVYNVNGVKWI